MQQVVFQRSIQCRGNFDPDIEHDQFRDLTLLVNVTIETTRAGQFHHKVQLVVVFAEMIQVDDVRVVQLSHRSSFGIK